MNADEIILVGFLVVVVVLTPAIIYLMGKEELDK